MLEIIGSSVLLPEKMFVLLNNNPHGEPCELIKHVKNKVADFYTTQDTKNSEQLAAFSIFVLLKENHMIILSQRTCTYGAFRDGKQCSNKTR